LTDLTPIEDAEEEYPYEPPDYVSFPHGFVATRHPGYYWNIYDDQLYSCKSGELIPLTKSKWFDRHRKSPGRKPTGLFHGELGYKVSVKGKAKFIPLRELRKLLPVKSSFPIGRRPVKMASFKIGP
jgi:hypothetical protein